MTPEDWKLVKKHLEDALEHPPAERASLLDEVCGHNGWLRAELESLLEAERHVGDFLKDPIFDLHEESRKEGSG